MFFHIFCVIQLEIQTTVVLWTEFSYAVGDSSKSNTKFSGLTRSDFYQIFKMIEVTTSKWSARRAKYDARI